VTESGNSQNDVLLETSIPAVSLESIVRTHELRNRPSRSPDYETENRALVALANALADSPGTILQTLADRVFELLHADSAGLSLLTKDEKRFYWAAIAGAWRPHTGSNVPRNSCPCGDVLDHNIPMLFTRWERRYQNFSRTMPITEEGLFVPFYVNGKPVGTIWAFAHDDRRKFDGEDLRLLERTSRFASAAYQVLESIENLKLEISAREKAETAVREVANGLETQVRVRTQELECSTRELLETNKDLEREIAGRKLVEGRLRQEERELKRSQAFLTEAQHLSRTGSFSWRVATDEITWSEHLYRIFEFDVGVPVTLDLIRTRVHPEDIPLFDDMIARARGVGRDFEYENRLLMSDHSVKYLHTAAHGTRDQDGRLEYIGAVQDVTQRRLSEETVARARAELANIARVTSLGVLTASIAHELNQPLFGIVTNADTCLLMLSSDSPDVESARETARRTIRDANRASDVIKRLRALYSKKDPSPEWMDLNEATRDVISLLLSDLQRHRVVLRQELADDLPLVIADRVQLQQVIMNLLRNASDAMSNVGDRPRTLVIRTERDEGDRVRLSVKDAGVGFEAQAAGRLFEAFYTTKNEGMGIGLSISRSIIEAHQGYLWATANDGPGATFSFSIPCRAASSAVGETHASLTDGAMDAA
jgi:signal transduction histidine kinase